MNCTATKIHLMIENDDSRYNGTNRKESRIRLNSNAFSQKFCSNKAPQLTNVAITKAAVA